MNASNTKPLSFSTWCQLKIAFSNRILFSQNRKKDIMLKKKNNTDKKKSSIYI